MGSTSKPKTVRVLFDVTREVRSLGWVMDDVEKIKARLKSGLSNHTLPSAFAQHYKDRADLLSRKDLLVRVIAHRQLQGGLRFLFQYSYVRDYATT